MQHLFSTQGHLALARVLQDDPLLAFDFDGTLTPIVADPDLVRLDPVVSGRLAALAARRSVAVVTGRSIADVRGRLGFQPRFIAGNHGAELEAQGDPPRPVPAPSQALAPVRLHLQANGPALLAAGVTVEDKGLSLALHYRRSPAPEHARQLIMRLLADQGDALKTYYGKLVVNIAPKLAPDKSDAVRALVERCGAPCAVFAGDDANDEPVFATAPAHWLTIRVGQDRSGSNAQFYLEGPHEMAQLIERMLTLSGVT